MIELGVFLTLLVLGFGFGEYSERRHYQSIHRREKALADILVFSARRVDRSLPVENSVLVNGSVVVSVDYFKRFVAGLRNLLGGRVGAYETLLDRGRREAILRMKEQARTLGAELIFNTKLETSSISKGYKDNIGSIEVLAYGTAVRTRH